MAATAPKTQYNAVATSYNSVTDLPTSKLEAQLIRTALGDCTGLHVLDLGGGSGLHARRALDEAHAESVDAVDISREMMRVGEEIERQAAREGKIRWFEADLSRPVGEQIKDRGLREEGYDVVMANWLFDHATSVEDLRGMWGNVVRYLKPGGRFLGVRVQSIRADYMKDGKYGATFEAVEKIPGGLKYQCSLLTDPPFSFEATSMESTYSLVDDIPKELGLVEFKVVPPEDMEIVKADLEFWEDFLQDPNMAVVTATKPEV